MKNDAHQSMILSRRAESLRLSGNYSESVALFDKAIEAQPDNAWAWAHRGAAKVGLLHVARSVDDIHPVLEMCEAVHGWTKGREIAYPELPAPAAATTHAVYDLSKALELRRRGGNEKAYWWVYGHIGEALRLYAMYPPVDLGPKSLSCHVQRSIELSARYFDDAVAESNAGDAWMLAHRGAVSTFRCWMAELLSPKGAGDAAALAAAASRDFDAAFALNPYYGWAKVFKAFLLTLQGDYRGASEELGLAFQRDDHGKNILRRALCELQSYSSGTAITDDAAGDASAKREALRDTVRLGWGALQLDQDDVHAMYHVATGLHRLKDPLAPIAVVMARTRLYTTLNHINMMLAGLDLCEHGKAGTSWRRLLEELRSHIDMQTVAMIQHDPVWNGVRDEAEYEALMAGIHTWLK
jgi:tetratricopeptide (TPR) repeat protein